MAGLYSLVGGDVSWLFHTMAISKAHSAVTVPVNVIVKEIFPVPVAQTVTGGKQYDVLDDRVADVVPTGYMFCVRPLPAGKSFQANVNTMVPEPLALLA